jgi:hypothetical protein
MTNAAAFIRGTTMWLRTKMSIKHDVGFGSGAFASPDTRTLNLANLDSFAKANPHS